MPINTIMQLVRVVYPDAHAELVEHFKSWEIYGRNKLLGMGDTAEAAWAMAARIIAASVEQERKAGV